MELRWAIFFMLQGYQLGLLLYDDSPGCVAQRFSVVAHHSQQPRNRMKVDEIRSRSIALFTHPYLIAFELPN